jgi:hypothetical protein
MKPEFVVSLMATPVKRGSWSCHVVPALSSPRAHRWCVVGLTTRSEGRSSAAPFLPARHALPWSPTSATKSSTTRQLGEQHRHRERSCVAIATHRRVLILEARGLDLGAVRVEVVVLQQLFVDVRRQRRVGNAVFLKTRPKPSTDVSPDRHAAGYEPDVPRTDRPRAACASRWHRPRRRRGARAPDWTPACR